MIKLLLSAAALRSTQRAPSPRASAAFDAVEFESNRLARDAEAMSAMKAEAEAEFATLRTPWKCVPATCLLILVRTITAER